MFATITISDDEVILEEGRSLFLCDGVPHRKKQNSTQKEVRK